MAVLSPPIRSNALTYAAHEVGFSMYYPGTKCKIEYCKVSGRSAVACPLGSALGETRQSLQTGSIAGIGTGNTLGSVTPDLSDSDSILPRGVALNVFSNSAGSYRFGWMFTSGSLKELNRALARDGIASIQIRVSSVAARGILGFTTDGRFKTLAATTLTTGRYNRSFGVALEAGVGSALSAAMIGAQYT